MVPGRMRRHASGTGSIGVLGADFRRRVALANDEEDRVAVELDPQLMDILACPSEDHAPLRVGTPDDPEADMLTCTACGRRFPVIDGIPVLLLDEATAPATPPPGSTPPGSTLPGSTLPGSVGG